MITFETMYLILIMLSTQFIVNVTTANIHATQHPAVATRAAYTVSKFAGTLFFQCLAQDYPPEKIQIISFHPGLIYNDYWKSLGIDPKHFDDGELYPLLSPRNALTYW
jgi:NAD(P)-dependent dehydrogenase (short-subunit alcohol dehydrogenase family)